MNWGKGIVISFLLFIAFMAVMITIMMRQDIGLVSKQYYKEDLNYQAQYERKKNAEQLEIQPEISFENDYLKVSFQGKVESGEVTLFRPSDDSQDQNFKLKTSGDSVQLFLLKPLEQGVYRIKMTWNAEGKEYYIDKVIIH